MITSIHRNHGVISILNRTNQMSITDRNNNNKTYDGSMWEYWRVDDIRRCSQSVSIKAFDIKSALPISLRRGLWYQFATIQASFRYQIVQNDVSLMSNLCNSSRIELRFCRRSTNHLAIDPPRPTDIAPPRALTSIRYHSAWKLLSGLYWINC